MNIYSNTRQMNSMSIDANSAVLLSNEKRYVDGVDPVKEMFGGIFELADELNQIAEDGLERLNESLEFFELFAEVGLADDGEKDGGDSASNDSSSSSSSSSSNSKESSDKVEGIFASLGQFIQKIVNAIKDFFKKAFGKMSEAIKKDTDNQIYGKYEKYFKAEYFSDFPGVKDFDRDRYFKLVEIVNKDGFADIVRNDTFEEVSRVYGRYDDEIKKIAKSASYADSEAENDIKDRMAEAYDKFEEEFNKALENSSKSSEDDKKEKYDKGEVFKMSFDEAGKIKDIYENSSANLSTIKGGMDSLTGEIEKQLSSLKEDESVMKACKNSIGAYGAQIQSKITTKCANYFRKAASSALSDISWFYNTTRQLYIVIGSYCKQKYVKANKKDNNEEK